MITKRFSGILLHPTSLPTDYGIGDLGLSAYRFLDFLAESGQALWQMLPIGPCGKGNSPYMSYGSSAGNSLLIAPDHLLDEDLLSAQDISDAPAFATTQVDYSLVTAWKDKLLRKAFSRYAAKPRPRMQVEYHGFCRGASGWLDDHALFMALLNAHDGASWTQWPSSIRQRDPSALAECRESMRAEIEFQKFVQFLFFRQWFQLKEYANQQGIKILGDLPIYVSHTSSDVWANQNVFQIDPITGEPFQVAGVPPDYFSSTGQLWGNPVYNWEHLRSTGFHWWLSRMRHACSCFDYVRLDHFRALDAYWSIPADEETAQNGQWIKAPGQDLLTTLQDYFGPLPIIAEDLGVIDGDVIRLRDHFGLPGMRILQFAFSGGVDNPFLPFNHRSNAVVYTGTHDNNTSLGWWMQDATSDEKAYVERLLGPFSEQDFVWTFIRSAMSSVANVAVFPLQDILELNHRARMNTPSTSAGNWTWRFPEEAVTHELASRLRQLTEDCGR